MAGREVCSVGTAGVYLEKLTGEEEEVRRQAKPLLPTEFKKCTWPLSGTVGWFLRQIKWFPASECSFFT